MNGATVTGNQTILNTRFLLLSDTLPLAAGDIVEVAAYNYGSPIALSPFTSEPHLTVALVSAL
ncbi:hypothetical protein [Ruania halotolerans]|uniref:hypothetical protein n=1 Tax=Ruania halotolerans TaxID=2897773 RepID=UPI001E350149|nr:hypothetical protein [Ruania halotolerans]UFU05485.1 hypothetical protein LQF10_13650 [Ruania halotolerans]